MNNFLIKNKIFAAGVSLIIIFTCLEVLSIVLFSILDKDIKAFQYYPGRYQKSEELGYELTPYWELNHDTLYEKFNSHGFRSPEVEKVKPENHFRIIITGSSIVYGRTSNKHTISSMLEKKLNEIYGEKITVEVINAGVPGYNSFHILRQFDDKLKSFSPDLIINYQFFTDLSIIEYGNNVAASGKFHNPSDSRFRKNLLKNIIDQSYFLTMLKIASRKSSLHQKTNHSKSDARSFSDNEIEINKINQQFEIEEKLTFIRNNVYKLINKCEKNNIDIMLCIPISLYKMSNTPIEIAMIDNYESKDEILKAIGIANEMIKEASTNAHNAYYCDISKNIKIESSLFDDKYHTLEKGNDIVSEELKKFIVSNKFILK